MMRRNESPREWRAEAETFGGGVYEQNPARRAGGAGRDRADDLSDEADARTTAARGAVPSAAASGDGGACGEGGRQRTARRRGARGRDVGLALRLRHGVRRAIRGGVG